MARLGSPRRYLAASALLTALVTPLSSRADEGQWMPSQISRIEGLQAHGLQLKPQDVWNEDDGGLMRAIVNLSGCSAGFISKRGLVATNHHCAYGAIQAQSTEEHDYLTNGFVAGSLAEELEAKGKTIKVLVAIDDVTDVVHEVVKANEDPAERHEAVEAKQKELVAACEEDHPGHSCRVANFYRGATFQLHRYLELLDVRLVLAPPSSVGNYGGEVDNWMWPRHSGDFSILRAYVGPDGKPAPYAEDNVPYEPERWLEVSPDGVAPGDFVAVLGYPGHTDRYLSLPETKRQVEQFLPARVDLYGEWIRIYEDAGARDPAVKIKVAARLRSLANRHKNARGMLAGIEAIGLLAHREKEDAELRDWATKRSNNLHADALDRLAQLSAERRKAFAVGFLVDNATRSSVALEVAVRLVRWAKERTKPDLERREGYMDRDHDRVWSRIERGLRDFDPGVDTATARIWLDRVAAVQADTPITSVRSDQLTSIFAHSSVMKTERAQELFDAADWAAIESSRDPLLAWARDVVEALEAREAQEGAWEGEMLEIGPLYFEMVKAVRGGAIYPDANGTLRFSSATVEGYSPKDGLEATPQTTVAGQVAKFTGEEPFDLAEAVRKAAPRAPSTYWSDPGLGDVPVCFLSNADTTGGNSGSPVVDGRGRWVGLNFDRVWENIAGDFGWRPDRSRNITVDIRYLLWTMDEVFGATHLLGELGVAEYADAPPRPATAQRSTDSPPREPMQTAAGIALNPAAASSPEPERAGCGCSSRPNTPRSALLWIAVVAMVARRRRPYC
jgi:MYXO-CTERM domain-containing protein